MDSIFQKEFKSGRFIIYPDKPNFDNLIFLNQTHSNKVVLFDKNFNNNQNADGIIFRNDNYSAKFAIRTADCLPVVLIGNTHTALIHSGWRGIQNKILLNSKIFKIMPHTIFIGPSISSKAFEVTKEFINNFPESKSFIKRDGKIFFDLHKEAINQLQSAYKDAKVSQSEICTFSNNKFNSYRRDNTKIRNWNLFINMRE